MAAPNTRYLPDVALLAVATYYIVRAIHPPHLAAAADRVGAKKRAQEDDKDKDAKPSSDDEGSGDLMSSLGLTSLTPIPVQAAFILAAIWSSRALLSGKGWKDVSAGSSTLPVNWRVLFAVGNLLTTLGGIVRLRCYRELGKFFTFDLAVQQGQKVVDTGPYAYARHPSYTSLILGFYGSAISYLMANPAGSLRGWSKESLATLVVLHTASMTWLLRRRISDEEKMMRREMGKAYEEYEKKVPWRLVPGLY